METLRRVARVHRRWLRTWGRRIAALVALALVCAGGWLAVRPTVAPAVAVAVAAVEVETEVVREVARGPLLSVRVQSPLSPAGLEPPRCPPVDVAGPRFAGEPHDPDAPAPTTPVTQVLSSPTRAGWLAVRTGSRALLSRDDGRSFAPVLERPGPLVDLAFGCAGQLYALRGADTRGGLELGVHGAGGDRWRPLRLGRCAVEPGAEHALQAGAGWLVVVLDHHGCDPALGVRAWVSADRGRSFRPLSIPDAPVVEGIRVIDIRRDRLRLVAYEGDCKYDGTVVHDLDPRTGDPLRSFVASRDFQLWDLAARGRWIYSHRPCSDGRLCRARLGGPPSREYDDSPAWTAVRPVLLDGRPRQPRLLAGPHHLYSLDARGFWHLGQGRARPAGPAPGDVTFQAVDPFGRILGKSSRGHLVRWSRLGTRVLQAVDNPPADR